MMVWMSVTVFVVIFSKYDVVETLRILFFFFKERTAYEMRISDWSSDVCSSDLALEIGVVEVEAAPMMAGGRHRHDACAPRGMQGGQHQRRQVEVTDMIDSELHLETLRGAHQRTGHDVGIVDEQMQRRLTVGGRESFDRAQVARRAEGRGGEGGGRRCEYWGA